MLLRSGILFTLRLVACATCLLLFACDQSPGTPTTASRTADAPPPPPLPLEYPEIDPLVAEQVDLAHTAIVDSPENASAWAELGMLYHANRYDELAETCYRQSLKLDNSQAPIWFHLAMLYAEQSNMSQGAEIMQSAIDLQPDFAPAHWRRGLMLFDQGLLDEAHAEFQAATEADAFDMAGWFGLARVALEHGDHPTARTIIDTRLIHGPHEAYARSLLSRSLRMQGQTEQAAIEAARGRAAELPWKDAWSRQIISRRTGLLSQRSTAALLRSRNRHAEALRIYSVLHDRWPDDPEVVNGMALSLARTGASARAMALLNDYRDHHPQHYETITNLAHVHLIAADTPMATQHALALLDESLAIQPAFARTHEVKAEAHFQNRSFDEAADAYRRAFECDARKDHLLVEIGRCHIAQRRWHDAATAFDTALEHNPADGDAWLGLGIARMEQHDLDGAQDALVTAGTLIKPNEAAFNVLAKRMQTLQQRRRGRQP